MILSMPPSITARGFGTSTIRFKPAELQKIADVLGASGTNMDSVWLALGVAPSGTAMPAAPAEEAPAEEAAAEAADDAADAKEEKKAPAKKKAAKKKK